MEASNMKRYMKPLRHIGLVLLALLSGVLTSCEYKDLCYQHPHWVDVNVHFDWKNEPDAQPEGMTVLFYNMDDPASDPVRFDLPGRNGGTVNLMTGRYRAVAYNYDTDAILYRNTGTISTYEAYTRQSSIGEGTQMPYGDLPRGEGKDDEDIILAPNMLWGATHPGFEIEMQDPVTYDYVKEGETAVTHNSYDITMEPGKRICQVTVNVHDVPNMKYTSNFAGALSSLSPSVFMESAAFGEGSVAQAFAFDKVDATTLQAKFYSFGHCSRLAENIVNTHYLSVYALLDDETKWYYNIDVTDQVHDQVKNPNKYNIVIDIYDLPIPKPITNGSGIKPTVDAWTNINIELPER